MLFLQKILLLLRYVGWFCGESHHKIANMLYETIYDFKDLPQILLNSGSVLKTRDLAMFVLM